MATNLQTLTIHKLSQAQYDKEKTSSSFDNSAFYLTPAEEIPTIGEVWVEAEGSIPAENESDVLILEGEVPVNISASKETKTVSFSINSASTDTPGVVKLTNDVTNIEDATAITPAGVQNAINGLNSKEPTFNGNTTDYTFIDSVTQTKGIVYATKKAIPYADENTSGIVRLYNGVSSTADNLAVTQNSLQKKVSIDNHNTNYRVLRDMALVFDNITSSIIVIPEGLETINKDLEEITSKKSTAKVAVIPHGVVKIGSSAFSDCTALTSIIIPNSITTSYSEAFDDCEKLQNIYYSGTADEWAQINFSSVRSSPLDRIDSYPYKTLYLNNNVLKDCVLTTVTEIPSRAFQNCSSITSVEIPGTVTSIGAYAFYHCNELASVEIGNSVTSIGNYAFMYCNSLTDVYITNLSAWCNITGLSNIMNYGASSKNLYLDNELITELIIPDGVTSIGDYVFKGCTELESVVIPNSVTSIGGHAFEGCSNLTSVIIGDSVTSIGEQAFYGCSSLTSVVIGDSVTSIGYRTFAGCSSLTSVVIPNSVISIDSGAFNTCSSLTSVVIPDSVISMGDSVFYGCSNLTNIYCEAITQPTGWSSMWKNSSDTAVTWNSLGQITTNAAYNYYITKDNNTAVLTEYKGADTDVTIPNTIDTYSVSGIKTTFSNNNTINSIEIPNSITKLESGAFRNCTNLTSVTLPNSVISSDTYAFEGCSSLTKVNYLGSIDDWAQIKFGNPNANPLYYAKQLKIDGKVITEVNLTTATSIKPYAFYNCSSLTSIEIPDSVTSIGEKAFEGCDNLVSIKVPASAISVLPQSNLKTATITSGEIPNYAFRDCSGLTSVVISDSVTSIGYAAFRNCGNLTSVVISNSVTSIREWTFEGCYSLTSIEIPDSVTSIGEKAFYSCRSLTSIVIPKSVTYITKQAFYGCDRLVEVVSKSTNINVIQGSTDNGSVGRYALAVYNVNDEYQTKLSNDNGYIIYTDGAEKVLVGYSGTETALTLPSYITKINYGAFEYYDTLVAVLVPDSVKSIGAMAFYSCDSLISVVLSNSLTSIGSHAFAFCRKLPSITIPNSVTSIGACAFGYGEHLHMIEIPDSVTSIGEEAFISSDVLTLVIIGTGVKSIGTNAFRDCTNLTDIKYRGNETQWNSISQGYYSIPSTCKVTYNYQD